MGARLVSLVVVVAVLGWSLTATAQDEESGVVVVRDRLAEDLAMPSERAAWRLPTTGTADAPPTVVACQVAVIAVRVAGRVPSVLGLGRTIPIPARLDPAQANALVETFEAAAEDASEAAEGAGADAAQRLESAYTALNEASLALAYCDEETDESAALEHTVAAVSASIDAGLGRSIAIDVVREGLRVLIGRTRRPRPRVAARDPYERF